MPSVPLLFKDNYCPAGFEPLSINQETGIRRYYRHLGDGNVHLIAVQPADEIIKQNDAERYNARGTFTAKGKWGYKAASIPTMLYENWKRHEDGSLLDDDDFAKVKKRNLNSNEFYKLRVGEAQL